MKCDKTPPPDALKLNFNNSTYRVFFFGYSKTTGIITPINPLDVPVDLDNTINLAGFTIADNLNQFAIIQRRSNNVVESFLCDQLSSDYPQEICSANSLDEVEGLYEKLASDIETCIDQNLQWKFNTSFPSTFEIDLDVIADGIQNQLDIAYFSNVKVSITISTSRGETRTLRTVGVDEGDALDFVIEYFVDYENHSISCNESINPEFFNNDALAEHLKTRAQVDNLSLSDLNLYSLAAIEDLDEERFTSSLSFFQNLANFFTNHAKTFQVTGKVARNIWEEGELPEGCWYSKNENYQYYKDGYSVSPVPGGAIDAVIDYTASIPASIRQCGQIIFNKEKRSQFLGLFSIDGIKAMYDGFCEDVKDDEKRPYIITKTTTEAGISFATGGALFKITDNLIENGLRQTLNQFIESLPNGAKLAQGLSEVKFRELVEAVKSLGPKFKLDAVKDEILKQLEFFTEKTRVKFAVDLVNDAEFFKTIIQNPDIIKLFQVHKLDLALDDVEDLYQLFDRIHDNSPLLEKWKTYGEETQAMLERFKRAKIVETDKLSELARNIDFFETQVTFDLELPDSWIDRLPESVKFKRIENNKIIITTITDGVGVDGNGKIFLHEVKATSKGLANGDATLLTPQQKILKEIIDNPDQQIGRILPRGAKAEDIFKDVAEIGEDLMQNPNFVKNLEIHNVPTTFD